MVKPEELHYGPHWRQFNWEQEIDGFLSKIRLEKEECTGIFSVKLESKYKEDLETLLRDYQKHWKLKWGYSADEDDLDFWVAHLSFIIPAKIITENQ